MSDLKSTRVSKQLTQREAAKELGVSLRSYISYENDPDKQNTIKYNYLLNELEQRFRIDEEHGVLSIDNIIDVCFPILERYNTNYCYLFGSYAKGTATEKSDVDLLISTEISGLKFYSLAEELREKLKKNIDILDIKQLNNNEALLDEILKYGIKIYGLY